MELIGNNYITPPESRLGPQSTVRIYNLTSPTDCFGIQVTTRYPPHAICARRRTYARRRRDIARDNNGDLYPGIRAARVSRATAKSFSATEFEPKYSAKFGYLLEGPRLALSSSLYE